MTDQVVITGIGALTPVGNDRETTWRSLLGGTSGVATISAFDTGGLPVRIAAEVKGFDPAAVLEGKRLRRSARFTQLAAAAAREAVADARGARDREAVRPQRGAQRHPRSGAGSHCTGRPAA